LSAQLYNDVATNAPFSVYDNTTFLDVVQVNQRVAPNSVSMSGRTWQSLGEYSADSGTLVVQLTDFYYDYQNYREYFANGAILADAV
jgi:hypothetical protein